MRADGILRCSPILWSTLIVLKHHTPHVRASGSKSYLFHLKQHIVSHLSPPPNDWRWRSLRSGFDGCTCPAFGRDMLGSLGAYENMDEERITRQRNIPSLSSSLNLKGKRCGASDSTTKAVCWCFLLLVQFKRSERREVRLWPFTKHFISEALWLQFMEKMNCHYILYINYPQRMNPTAAYSVLYQQVFTYPMKYLRTYQMERRKISYRRACFQDWLQDFGDCLRLRFVALSEMSPQRLNGLPRNVMQSWSPRRMNC